MSTPKRKTQKPFIKQQTVLPFCRVVTFQLKDDEITTDWTPLTPHYRHWNNQPFCNAYAQARNTFMQRVAETYGRKIIVHETDEDGLAEFVGEFHPAANVFN